MKKKIVKSKITFPNGRIKKGDELYYIGKKYNTHFLISKKELRDSSFNLKYLELLRFSENEIVFTDLIVDLTHYKKGIHGKFKKEKGYR